MKQNTTLTRDEAVLAMIVTGSASLPGLPEFAIDRNTPPGETERDGLIQKGILHRRPNGRLALDESLGAMLLAVRSCPAYLWGGICYAGGNVRRHNLYLTGDSFVLVSQERDGFWRFAWLPTIHLAMGSIIRLLEEGPGGGQRVGPFFEPDDGLPGLLERGATAASGFLLHGADGDRLFRCLCLSGNRFAAVCEDGSTVPGSLAEVLKPLSEALLQEHVRSFGGA